VIKRFIPASALGWILLIFSLPIILIVLVIAFSFFNDMQRTLRGYHVMSTGWELGEMLAKNGSSASECLKFRSPTFDIMTPSRGEHVGMCVREYAKLTKDPSACELLMPSDYGWDCLAQAERPNARMCWFDFGKNTQKIGNAALPECGSGNEAYAPRCCAMATKLYVEQTHHCDDFTDDSVLHDQCLELLARRERTVETCADITDENVRTGCEVAVRALQ